MLKYTSLLIALIPVLLQIVNSKLEGYDLNDASGERDEYGFLIDERMDAEGFIDLGQVSFDYNSDNSFYIIPPEYEETSVIDEEEEPLFSASDEEKISDITVGSSISTADITSTLSDAQLSLSEDDIAFV